MSEIEKLRKEYDAAVKRRHGKIGATGLEIRAAALIAALGDEIAELTGQNIDLEVWRASAVKRAEQAEAVLAAEREKRCVSCEWLKERLGKYECLNVTELRESPDPDEFACNRYSARQAPEVEP